MPTQPDRKQAAPKPFENEPRDRPAKKETEEPTRKMKPDDDGGTDQRRTKQTPGLND